MFLGVDRTEELGEDRLRGQRPFAVALVLLIVASIVALGSEAKWSGGASSVVGPNQGPYQNVADLGKAIFTDYLFAFELTAGLVVIAVVGAVVLARRSADSNSDDADAQLLSAQGQPEGVDQ